MLRRLAPLRIKWAAQVSIDVAGRPDLLELMAASGCVAVTIGFESMKPDNLSQMGKAWNNRFGDYESVVAAIRRHGIMVYGTFVFGYDKDTPEAIEEAPGSPARRPAAAKATMRRKRASSSITGSQPALRRKISR